LNIYYFLAPAKGGSQGEVCITFTLALEPRAPIGLSDGRRLATLRKSTLAGPVLLARGTRCNWLLLLLLLLLRRRRPR